MAELKEWQYAFRDTISAMPNDVLFNTIIEESAGDDWDGNFTKRGAWELNYMIGILRERMGWVE